jgi:hypothetical protein
MRDRTRSERNWHTPEPHRSPDEGVRADGGVEDTFRASPPAPPAGSESFHDELPPGSGYGVGGGRGFDPAMRQGARGNRAERFTGEGERQDRESWSRARPRRPRGPQDPEWRTGERGQTRARGHDWGRPVSGGHSAQPRGNEWYGSDEGQEEDNIPPNAPRTAGFGWGGAPTGYGEWGGLQNGPFRAEPGHGGYGGQWGSPSGTHQGNRDWNREHGMRGGEPWTVPGPHTGRGPQGYERSDQAILEDVCERLTRHGEVDASDITVRCEQREVTLEGTVEDRRAKRLAEDTAESVFGVRDVQNRLRIRDREDMRAADGSEAPAQTPEPESPRRQRRRK